ncbi:MAG TPA: HlyD family type I secretion periplasmic adaptor subunit, partial [Cyanobacteria bacterium UBA9579]|nr:HlyD family type I secretion periplasmic adaptor subunit [Cyanobacteria bacterium UBA9579]
MFSKIKEFFRKLSLKVYKFLGKDDSHEFKPILAEIEENPVSPLGRSIFWIIIGIMVFTALWMHFGKIDVVISARGTVIPDGEIKILQPLETGAIEKILVKEGDFVKKGQVVMEINPSTIDPELESTQQNLAHTQLEMNRLRSLASGSKYSESGEDIAAKTQKEIYESTLGSLRKQLLTKEIEFSKVEERINAAKAEKGNYQVLLDTRIDKEKRLKPVIDIIAKDEYEKVLTDISTYESNLKSLSHKLEELSQQKQQVLEEIAYIKQRFKSENLNELSDKQKRVNEMQAYIQEATFKSARQKITSPVDGYVNTIMMHTVGGVVTPAEKLVSIVPANTPLVIKATVLNKDIGFVQPGMPVSIKIDTYEFQKYGILDGEVKTVAKTSIEHEKLGPVYEVYITPINTTLKVEGKEKSIYPGLSLTAEIKVKKRRIIEFFIYPLIKYWNEG